MTSEKSRMSCPHGRQRCRCKECGGGSICEHGRDRTRCKKCGGSGLCEHGRDRSRCKDCGGGSICEHNRQRYLCKECGGGGFCTHRIQRSICKECGGTGICHHGRRRTRCKECGGAGICHHGRRRTRCKECKEAKNEKWKIINQVPPLSSEEWYPTYSSTLLLCCVDMMILLWQTWQTNHWTFSPLNYLWTLYTALWCTRTPWSAWVQNSKKPCRKDTSEEECVCYVWGFLYSWSC